MAKNIYQFKTIPLYGVKTYDSECFEAHKLLMALDSFLRARKDFDPWFIVARGLTLIRVSSASEMAKLESLSGADYRTLANLPHKVESFVKEN